MTTQQPKESVKHTLNACLLFNGCGCETKGYGDRIWFCKKHERIFYTHQALLEIMRDVAAMLPVASRLHPDDLCKLQTKVVEAITLAERE